MGNSSEKKQLTIVRRETENDRDKIDGVPLVRSEYERIRWHMFHDVSYYFTSNNPYSGSGREAYDQRT